MKEGGPIKPTATISYPSWAVGIPNTILCIEMLAVSILHIFAYPHEPYRLRLKATDNLNSDDFRVRDHDQYPLNQVLVTRSHEGWTPQHYDAAGECVRDGPRRLHQAAEPHEYVGGFKWKALVDALNLVDVVSAVVTASRWLVAERREDMAQALAVNSDFDNPYSAGDSSGGKTSDLSLALERAQATTSSRLSG